MTETAVFEPSAAAKARTLTTAEQYDALYQRSISDPDGFWGEQAELIQQLMCQGEVDGTSLAQRHGIELPISELVQRVLHDEITPVEGLQMLLSREQKPEYPEGLFE